MTVLTLEGFVLASVVPALRAPHLPCFWVAFWTCCDRRFRLCHRRDGRLVFAGRFDKMIAVPGEVDNPNVLSIFICDLDLTGVTLGDDLANQPRLRFIVVI